MRIFASALLLLSLTASAYAQGTGQNTNCNCSSVTDRYVKTVPAPNINPPDDTPPKGAPWGQ
jgi:hypothetical protein